MREKSNIRPITQRDVNRILVREIKINEKKVFSEIKEILEKHLRGISDNRSGSVIYKAHAQPDGVLIKNDIYYELRPIRGIDKLNAKIRALLNEMEKMPMGDFGQTIDKFAYEDVKAELQLISQRLEKRYRII